ncbi:MAG: GNAT family N-acetyltransferase [Pseudomonadota bacterium]
MRRVFQSKRISYRVPQLSDAQAIFESYASDTEVTKYLSWARHQVVADTEAFLEFAQAQWAEWKIGPLLLECVDTGQLLGSTGLDRVDKNTASTGYVIARDFWGRGLASEALGSMIEIAVQHDFQKVFAFCHRDHLVSRRVLERNGFSYKTCYEKRLVFPNLSAIPQDVCEYEYQC